MTMTEVAEMTNTKTDDGVKAQTPPAPQMPFLMSCCTAQGIREENQDVAATLAVIFDDKTPPCGLLVVADGMGGHSDGAEAARLAAKTSVGHVVNHLVSRYCDGADLDPPTALKKAFRAANDAVLAYSAEDPSGGDSGTTLVTALVEGDALWVASVGDSRAYHYHQGELTQLTIDDSFVQDLVAQGFLTPEEAEEHPRSHELTRAIGWANDADDLTIILEALEPGAVVLLGTDGLWKGGRRRMEEACVALSQKPYAQNALDDVCRELVDRAVAEGSDDNVTVAMLWCGPCGAPASATRYTVSHAANSEINNEEGE